MTFIPTPNRNPSEGEWDFYWCDVSWLRENFDHTYMDEHVRISHFRNHYEVSWAGRRGPSQPTHVTGCGHELELVQGSEQKSILEKCIRMWDAMPGGEYEG